MTERWLPVPEWEGLYEVSDHGRVRSLPRKTRRGIRGGQELAHRPDRKGYFRVALSRESNVQNRFVHQLVLEAFVGPMPDGMEAAHEDGDPTNNYLSNLSYKDKSGNMLDSVRHGTHRNSSKPSCPKCDGEYSVNYRGQRYCKPCRNAYQRARYAADPEPQLAAQRARREENLEHIRAIERVSKAKSRAAGRSS